MSFLCMLVLFSWWVSLWHLVHPIYPCIMAADIPFHSRLCIGKMSRHLLILSVTMICTRIYIVSLKHNQSPAAGNGWWDTCSAHVYSSMLMLALPWDGYPLWCAQVLFAALPPLLCCLLGRPMRDSLISPPPRERANILYACEIIPPPDVKRAEFVLPAHLVFSLTCSQKLCFTTFHQRQK